MKIPFVKKSIWILLAALFAAAMLANVFLVQPYKNQDVTTVEPVRFSGAYQLGDGAPFLPLSDDTRIDACVNRSVLFRGTFDRALKKDTQLLFFIEYLEVHVYLNGEEIYAWGTEKDHPAILRSSGAAWAHCVLPYAVSPGDEITISLESKYGNNYNSAYHHFLDSLQTGDSGALAREVLGRNWPFLLAGLLLFLAGLTLQMFLLSLARQRVAIHASIHYCALFILSASLWMIINPEYSTLLLGNAPLVMLLETVSMWLVSTFLLGYFGTFMHTAAKRFNDLLLFGFALSLLLFLALQLLGITDAYAVRDVHNILLLVVGVAFLCVVRYEVRHAEDSELRKLAVPGVLYAVFGVLELLNYELEWLPRGAALSVGFSIFIIAQFVFAVRQIRNSLLIEVKAAALERELADSRTAAMLSQIQPHFLYNSLQSIQSLCDTDPGGASDALEHFSLYLRGNLDALSDTRLVTFEKELLHIRDYLYLEKMRFEERLNIVWELEYLDFRLPPLTVQPLIENAVRHGITKKKSGGTLTIRTERTAEGVVVTVRDDGVGFDPLAPKKDGRTHVGIENTRGRLKALCGGELLVTSEKGIGTVSKIILPQLVPNTTRPPSR